MNQSVTRAMKSDRKIRLILIKTSENKAEELNPKMHYNLTFINYTSD